MSHNTFRQFYILDMKLFCRYDNWASGSFPTHTENQETNSRRLGLESNIYVLHYLILASKWLAVEIWALPSMSNKETETVRKQKRWLILYVSNPRSRTHDIWSLATAHTSASTLNRACYVIAWLIQIMGWFTRYY